MGGQEAEAFAEFVAAGGDPEEWEEEEQEDDWAAAAGVLERGRASVDGAWAPTEADAYETQMAMAAAMAMAQHQQQQQQQQVGLAGQGGQGLLSVRWLAALTVGWLAKDAAARLFRARM